MYIYLTILVIPNIHSRHPYVRLRKYPSLPAICTHCPYIHHGIAVREPRPQIKLQSSRRGITRREFLGNPPNSFTNPSYIDPLTGNSLQREPHFLVLVNRLHTFYIIRSQLERGQIALLVIDNTEVIPT
jgi:hypothetical protein